MTKKKLQYKLDKAIQDCNWLSIVLDGYDKMLKLKIMEEVEREKREERSKHEQSSCEEAVFGEMNEEGRSF